ncbi:hypothetical protein VQ03_20180 [Methylobacterium tarhaniae]|uniref:Glycosyltransferase 2-like domain-containing protein n=1 Tax=Methylobacterium tarhaniae TaxID=1187852 RepID=A0A0J6ST03_9HYPH|nr:glycosyltransferase family A protein [Methylobacterium tarhaniae]KMO36682.1 hypothetical protein VQ03_20180 [Methylobacterium tarhaniae]
MRTPRPARSGAPTTGPRIAVVIPVFRQPQFLVEAVASALDQDGEVACRVVIVNDGCPLPDTHALGLASALSDPRVIYLRTENRGLSAARNAGIDAALAQWPDLTAIAMLDADNRLAAGALARGYDVLARDATVSWVFPQINKFGITLSGHAAVPVSPLHVVFQGSFMDASSLVHRRVFDAGLRYDETLRDGFEDWDFWLGAWSRGFRGRCVPGMGLDYRYRPESMVRNAARQRPLLLESLRRRHPDLFAARVLLAAEQQHHPRYGLVDEVITRFTDAMAPAEPVPGTELAALLWRTLAEPEHASLPPYLLWGERAVVAALTRAKVLQTALRHLEAAADAAGGAAVLRLEAGDSIAVRPAEGEGEAHLVLLATGIAAAAVAGHRLPASDAADPPGDPAAGAAIVALARPDGAPAPGRALEALRATLATCRQEVSRWEPPQRWHWQLRTLPDARGIVEALRREIGGAPLSNLARRPDRPCLAVATADDPGEAVRTAARFLRATGSAPADIHLVLGGRGPGLVAVPSGATHLELLDWPESGAGAFRYFGQSFDLPPPDDPEWRSVRGALAGFDTLLVTTERLLPFLAEWRAKGTRIAVYQDPAGWPARADRLILAFEHAIDIVLVDTGEAATRLSALGIPAAKITVLPA